MDGSRRYLLLPSPPLLLSLPSLLPPTLANPNPQFFNDPQTHLVHDPNNSLRTGDVVAITPGWVTSQHKRHLVKHIIAPNGVPVEQRPPIPTEEENWAAKEAKKAAKDARRAEKAEAEKLARQKEREAKEERRRVKMAGREKEVSGTSGSDVD